MGNSAYYYRIGRQNVHAVGTKDGVNKTFSVPDSEVYLASSLKVYLNGQLLHPSVISKNIGFTSFTICDAEINVLSTDTLTVSYLVVS